MEGGAYLVDYFLTKDRYLQMCTAEGRERKHKQNFYHEVPEIHSTRDSGGLVDTAA